MSDPENVGTSEAESAAIPDSDGGLSIVTDEAREETAAEEEKARKKAIRKNMAGNLGDKTVSGKDTNAGRRDPRTQPDFEDHPEPETEE